MEYSISMEDFSYAINEIQDVYDKKILYLRKLLTKLF